MNVLILDICNGKITVRRVEKLLYMASLDARDNTKITDRGEKLTGLCN